MLGTSRTSALHLRPYIKPQYFLFHRNPHYCHVTRPAPWRSTTTSVHATLSHPIEPLVSTTPKRSFLPEPITKGPIYSKYYLPRQSEVIDFLVKHSQFPKVTTNPEELLIRCPHCRSKSKSTFYTLYMNVVKGTYHCTACMKKGSWKEFIHALRSKSGESFLVYKTGEKSGADATNFIMPIEEIHNFPSRLSEYPDILEWLTGRGPGQMGINKKVLESYQVGVAVYTGLEEQQQLSKNPLKKPPNDEEHTCVTFPQFAPRYTPNSSELGFEPVKINVLSSFNNEYVTHDPPNSNNCGLFGYQVAKMDAETIILTKSEYDAMAAYQQTGIPAVSLPANHYHLPLEVIPMLERFSHIYIWMDDDMIGTSQAARFAQKLGIDRCLIVNTRMDGLDGPLNAHEAMLANMDLNAIIARASPLGHEQIIGFNDLRDSVYREIINPMATMGIQSKDLPSLNKILKGHRPGELTILTGPTGVGKTTFISQLSLDYCRSGVSTLWGSFEIPNIRLAKKMLFQFAEKDLSKTPNEFEVWASKFQKLPLYFLKFFGSTEIKNVLEAMDHAIYAFDCSHIIIDNLQFMLSQQHTRTFDKYDIQDQALAQIRKFATDRNVHITLVVHPRKESGLLDVNSVFGSAKVTQEADNVILIQNDDGKKFIDIRKNRFDGTLGKINFSFDRESNKIHEYINSHKKETTDVHFQAPT